MVFSSSLPVRPSSPAGAPEPYWALPEEFSARLEAASFFFMAALLSVSCFLLGVLVVLVLDGGRLGRFGLVFLLLVVALSAFGGFRLLVSLASQVGSVLGWRWTLRRVGVASLPARFLLDERFWAAAWRSVPVSDRSPAVVEVAVRLAPEFDGTLGMLLHAARFCGR